MLVEHLVFLVLIADPSFVGVAGFLKFHDGVDVGDEVVALIGGVFGDECFVHHDSESLCLFF